MYVSFSHVLDLRLTRNALSAPLLIEIIACGALYTSEQSAAAELHTAALVLMREVRDSHYLCGSCRHLGWNRL
jgi:hypothetical protein